MARHAIETPVAIRVHRPSISAAIERVVSRALAKEPVDRFAGMAEFSAALIDETAEIVPAAGEALAAAKAVAVLPFVNASADPENEYFSDGMTDELITALAKVEGMHVASRTSVYALKGVKEDVRTIGTRLNVSAVLEGSVRKSGNRIRIAVQLTDVAGGRHALVGALRPRAGGRLCHSGRDREDDRRDAAVDAAPRHRRPGVGEVHREHQGVQPVPQGPLLVEPAFRAARRSRRGSGSSSRRSPKTPATRWRTPVWPIRTRCRWTTAMHRYARGWSGQRPKHAGHSSSTRRWPRRTRRSDG